MMRVASSPFVSHTTTSTERTFSATTPDTVTDHVPEVSTLVCPKYSTGPNGRGRSGWSSGSASSPHESQHKAPTVTITFSVEAPPATVTVPLKVTASALVCATPDPAPENPRTAATSAAATSKATCLFPTAPLQVRGGWSSLNMAEALLEAEDRSLLTCMVVCPPFPGKSANGTPPCQALAALPHHRSTLLWFATAPRWPCRRRGPAWRLLGGLCRGRRRWFPCRLSSPASGGRRPPPRCRPASTS